MVEVSTDSAARLRAVVGKLSRRLRLTLAEHGLTPTRVSVLATVIRMGPIRVTRLAEIEGLNPTMLSRVIAELAAQGYVRRRADPEDRRAALVEATTAGKRLRERIRNERNDVLAVQLGQMTAKDRDLLQRALPVLEELTERLRDQRT